MYKIKYHKINVYFSVSLYYKSFRPFCWTCEALCYEGEGKILQLVVGGDGQESSALGHEVRGRAQDLPGSQ